MGFMVLTMEDFIEKKEREFKKSKRLRKKIPIIDIGGGKRYYVLEDWVFLQQCDDPNKALFLEKLRETKKGRQKSKERYGKNIRYRIGYFIIGKVKDFPIKMIHEGGKFIWQGYTKIIFKKGEVSWEGYCPIIPKKDLERLLKKATKNKVISKDVLPGIF